MRGQILGGSGPVVKSVQRNSIAITGGSTTGTATITAVVLANSRIRMLGWTYNQVAGNANAGTGRITLTNTTTVTATVNTAPGADTFTVNFEVTEYWPGMLKSSTIYTWAATGLSTTKTITAVDDTTKTEVDYLGSSDTAGLTLSTIARVDLTNTTTLTARVGVFNAETITAQVVEFY